MATEYNGVLTGFVISSCLMAASGGLSFGFDIGVTGGVMSMVPFLDEFFPNVHDRMKTKTISNYCKYDNHLLTLFTSSMYIAGLVACLFASSITQAFGRKSSIKIGCVSFIVGAALGGAAQNIYMLIFGRIFLGIGIGFTNQAIPVYISEMALPRYRGIFNNGFHATIGFGFLLANIINYFTQKINGNWGWRISISVTGIPALILTICAFFYLPETPNSLIQRGQDSEQATLMLRRIRGVQDVQRELDDLVNANAVSQTIRYPFRRITERHYRPQLVMAIALPFFTQFTGITFIGFYAPILFLTIGFGETKALLCSVFTGVAAMIADFIAMVTVDRCGRRFLFMGGGIMMLVSLVIAGGLMAVHVGDQNKVGGAYAYTIMAFMFVYVIGFGSSWGPLGLLVPSEIFPLEVRSAGQSISIATNFLFTCVMAQTFLSMLCHFKSGLFFFFGGWVVVMTVFVYWFLPETKGLPIENMNRVWIEHWFWRRFVRQ